MTVEWGLFTDFPRIMGNPFRNEIVYNIDEINTYIKKYKMSYGGVHISVYSYFTFVDTFEEDEESALINKIFLDIDNDDWLEISQNIDNWLEIYDIIRTYNMSGKGIHFFIGCDSKIINKKKAVSNFQAFIMKKFNFQLDPSNIGDIARTFRINNIFNYKRNRYCIPLTRKILHTYSIEDIYKLAEKPFIPKETTIYGKKLIDLTKFDRNKYLYEEYTPKIHIDTIKILSKEDLYKLKIPFKKFPQCVQSWLKNKELGFIGRYLLVVYLRDQQIKRDDGSRVILSNNVIISILKYILNETTWLHVSTTTKLPGHNVGENLLPIKKALTKLTYKMYSCKQIKDCGLCPQDCGRKHPIYEYK